MDFPILSYNYVFSFLQIFFYYILANRIVSVPDSYNWLQIPGCKNNLYCTDHLFIVANYSYNREYWIYIFSHEKYRFLHFFLI